MSKIREIWETRRRSNINIPNPAIPQPNIPENGKKGSISLPWCQPWCQHGANHGANHDAMVPTNFLAISDHFWKKIFFGQKLCCPPPPPTLPTKGGDHGAKKPTMVPTWCQPWCHGANQFSRHIRSFLEENIFW